MGIPILKSIEITDDDIDWIEALLKDIKFDRCRRNIIKNLESVDVQACPGSGKTTVLVAKLAILSKNGPITTKVFAFFHIPMLLVKK